MGHTPEKWHLVIGSHDACVCNDEGTIADIPDTMTGWGDNAHLIAAAPDLLEACEEAYRLFTDELLTKGDALSIVREIKQAIASAKGES